MPTQIMPYNVPGITNNIPHCTRLITYHRAAPIISRGYHLKSSMPDPKTAFFFGKPERATASGTELQRTRHIQYNKQHCKTRMTSFRQVSLGSGAPSVKKCFLQKSATCNSAIIGEARAIYPCWHPGTAT